MNISDPALIFSMNSSSLSHCQQVVLAESQPIVFQPLVSQLKKLISTVILCSSYQELVDTCSTENPDLLILGTLPEVNCLDIYRKCHSRWQNLPIILLANQPVVNNYFKNWAMKQGVSNVVSSYPQEFPKLLAAIEELGQPITHPQATEEFLILSSMSEKEIFTMDISKATVALNEISEYSQRYFGALAIGNYWKKAREQVVNEHPWLSEWSIDHWGKIEYSSESPLNKDHLTPEQFQGLQALTEAFCKECQRVVVDFANVLKKKHLSPFVDQLLS